MKEHTGFQSQYVGPSLPRKKELKSFLRDDGHVHLKEEADVTIEVEEEGKMEQYGLQNMKRGR